MRLKRRIWGLFCALFVMALPVLQVFGAAGTVPVQGESEAGEMILLQGESETGETVTFEELSLYATAAALIDGDSGRVLYGKNQDTPLAMASTTKIMTCIVALEQEEDLGSMVTVSSYAASMPKVKLYIKKGEQYQLRELLFSLMLESHNDSAVAVAEYIGKQYLEEPLKSKDTAEFTAQESQMAVAAFARLMNEKAREIGCNQTYFITPNGLDATETITLESGESVTREHSTTAAELARILAYCIGKSPKRDLFLEITREPSYSFYQNGRNFSCSNHNAFLNQMEGALSGKTGFTNKAGYCYVGALREDDRTYVVALLGCGWPNHKDYKWSDTRELMNYGLEYYEYHDFAPQTQLGEIAVTDGAAPDGNPYHSVSLPVVKGEEVLPIRLLTAQGENVIARQECRDSLEAPVAEGTEVGAITYYLVELSGAERELAREMLYAGGSAEKKDFAYILSYVRKCFLLTK